MANCIFLAVISSALFLNCLHFCFDWQLTENLNAWFFSAWDLGHGVCSLSKEIDLSKNSLRIKYKQKHLQRQREKLLCMKLFLVNQFNNSVPLRNEECRRLTAILLPLCEKIDAEASIVQCSILWVLWIRHLEKFITNSKIELSSLDSGKPIGKISNFEFLI